MIAMYGGVVAWVWILLALTSFGLISGGCGLVARQVMYSPNPQRMLSMLLRGTASGVRWNQRGLRLIMAGTAVEALLCALVGVGLAFALASM